MADDLDIAQDLPVESGDETALPEDETAGEVKDASS